MKIPNRAYLDYANHGFAAGARTTVVEFLRELDKRGVEIGDEFTFLDLAVEVESNNLLED